MSRHAEAAHLTDPADVLADHAVAHSVPPLRHLSRAYAERQPVPGLRDYFLSQDHQQVVIGELPERVVRVSGVVLGDADKVQSADPGRGRELSWRQLAAARTG